jgi:hypothetical protein
MPVSLNQGFAERRFYYAFLQPFKAQLLECQLHQKQVVWPLSTSGPYPFELSNWLLVQPVFNYLLDTQRGELSRPNYGIDVRLFYPRGPAAGSIDNIISRIVPGQNLSDALVKANAQMIIIDQHYAAEPKVAEFMRNTPGNGWNMLSVQGTGTKQLWLYFRPYFALGTN